MKISSRELAVQKTEESSLAFGWRSAGVGYSTDRANLGLERGRGGGEEKDSKRCTKPEDHRAGFNVRLPPAAEELRATAPSFI